MNLVKTRLETRWRPLIRPAAMMVICAVISLDGCILSTHHAKVSPGWSGRFVVGARDEVLEPPESYAGWEYDDTETGKVSVQADFGYGKRFSQNRALYAGLIVPLIVHDGSMISGVAATSLDLYLQFLGEGALNAGVGGIAGIAVDGVYLEAGRTIYRGSNLQFELSAGVSREIHFLKDPAWRYFAVASWEYRRMELGFFADHIVADDVIK
ncbi:MAG TPA: hypothetical protein VLA34_00855, partial [Candidatus Krumholzibacterium sp.]|nr:hypothetical protein [Candidatus Krumholzibacterium sp.]